MSLANVRSQENMDNKPEAYLIRKVLLQFHTKGSIVLIPIDTKDIKMDTPDTERERQFWHILGKYFPETAKDSLTKIVASAPWLDKNIRIKKFKIHFPKLSTKESEDYRAITKRFHYAPVYYVSNPVYSKDKNTFIVYIYSPESGATTIVIKKNAKGVWYTDTEISEYLI
ncbi:hypothetical protein [Sediminibacterium sp.]|uniref:hypothetical protein n=1 Tax=Sediminibacterium sp. TaxID=1917865 RepID=UPI00273580AC|nr:hypothetical protein [Sediminibacterium sp.]MDP3394388.1 hypothetical protein [Sediminibacterium sp.]MDP3568223.1 hypothetical protein [Sediminibacterium sp.]